MLALLSRVFIVDFGQVITGWDVVFTRKNVLQYQKCLYYNFNSARCPPRKMSFRRIFSDVNYSIDEVKKLFFLIFPIFLNEITLLIFFDRLISIIII